VGPEDNPIDDNHGAASEEEAEFWNALEIAWCEFRAGKDPSEFTKDEMFQQGYGMAWRDCHKTLSK
jgi:hypothetical protein